MMTEASWLLPYVWTPESGPNWDVIFTYCVVLLFIKAPLDKMIEHLISFVKAKTNEVHFTIPLLGWKVDFSQYTWDDKFWDDASAMLKTKVLAKQSEAVNLKLTYKDAMVAASGDPAKMETVAKEYRAKMEQLTADLVQDVKIHGDPALWRALAYRLGDENKAAKWVADKAKAIVEAHKNGHKSWLEAVGEALKEGGADTGKG
jgi:hypothetical protein